MTGAGKRALVTGGAAGLGHALCAMLAGDGWHVTAIDRHPEPRDKFEHVICDLAQRAAVDELVVALGDGEPFDLVIFNAGISATGKFEAIEPDEHARVLAVNAEAPMVLCAGLARAGKLARGGNVLFISSLSHFTGYPGAASYAASKDAIAIYAGSIAKPFARDLGVTVSCAFPGPLKTAHAARHAPKGADPEKRMEPDVAARMILRDAFAGKAASFPGRNTKFAAVAGRMMPRLVTSVMRRVLYEKLAGADQPTKR